MRFILPSACQRGSGSPDLVLTDKRERAVRGCETPLVAGRRPDLDIHCAGEPRVNSLGQPGKITRGIERRRGGGACLPRRGPATTMSSIPPGQEVTPTAWTVQRGKYFTDEPLFLERCLSTMRDGRDSRWLGYLILTSPAADSSREQRVNVADQRILDAFQLSDVSIRWTHARSDSMVTG